MTSSSPGARKAWVRSDTSVDRLAIPGVSMRVIVRSDAEGHSTSSFSMSPAGVAPSTTSIAPPSRENGTCRGGALVRVERDFIGGAVVVPGDHLGALLRLVGASSSPTIAFSSVDLPALTFPAIATRSGSFNRRPIASRRGSAGVPRYDSFGGDEKRANLVEKGRHQTGSGAAAAIRSRRATIRCSSASTLASCAARSS